MPVPSLMSIDRVAEDPFYPTDDFVHPMQCHGPTKTELILHLERRFGRTYARQRLGIEHDHETRTSRSGVRLFRAEKRYTATWLVRTALRVSGLYRRAQRNAERFVVRENVVRSPNVPAPFNGYSILH